MLTRNPRFYAAIFATLAVVAPVAFCADVTVDLSKSTHIALPAAGDAPVAFKTSDGKEGWVRRLSNEAIPTPAYAKGKIFTGGGMTSGAFMAIDALTGKTLWHKTTQDNGPTSPVVSDNYVCYNTESCATETRDIDTGELSWSKITGGTLLTQPVVAGNILVIPHPTMERKSVMADDSFRMLAVDLKTGQQHWDRNMTADVLGAPVVAGEKVFFSCTDGRLFCISMGREPGWHVVANATSAPVVVGDTLAVTTEEKKTFGGAVVSIRRYSVSDGTLLDEKPLASTSVEQAVLAPNQRAEWDYQGPKLAAADKHLFNAPGATINSVDLESGKALWRASVSGLPNSANALTPPALGKKNLYIGSARGHILAVKQSDASLVFAYDISQPLASQPVLADGNLYFGTASGLLVCLKLQDADASDWTAWGGNAQHNKVE